MIDKLFVYILIVFCTACANPTSFEKVDLGSSSWFDRYGNEYRFGSGLLEWKNVYSNLWWEIGYYQVKDNSLKIMYSENSSCFQEENNATIEVISSNEDKIVFKESFKCFPRSKYANQKSQEFEIWRDREKLKDKEEKLISLSFTTRPQFMYNGIRAFYLDEERNTEIGLKDKDTVDSTIVMSSEVFENIEALLQIIPLEDLKEEYEYMIIDGVDFDIEIQTNKISKKISCKGGLPKDLNNLILYIDYEMFEN